MQIRAIIPVVIWCTVFGNGCGDGGSSSGKQMTTESSLGTRTETATETIIEATNNGKARKHEQQRPYPDEEVILPAGFQIIGAHGAVQVDSNLVNLGLSAKGTITIPAGGIGGPLAPAQIVVRAESPILCIRPIHTYATIRRVIRDGNQYAFTIQGGFSKPNYSVALAVFVKIVGKISN